SGMAVDAHELLLMGLRGDAAAVAGASAEQWRDAAGLAGDYQLAPLLYSKLRDAAAAEIPEQVRATLRQSYQATAAANLRHYHELGGMLRALQSAGVAAIVLKGSYLAVAAYANPAMRPMRDIDIMVRRTEMRAALECLGRLG